MERPGVNNVEKNEEQREEPKQLGGVTGRGFLPGQSGNPTGRPRTRGLVTALRAKLAEIGPDGSSIEERLAATLIEEGLRGKHRVSAIEVILDRLEGKPKQAIDFSDVSDDIRRRSTPELRFYLAHYRWPGPDELVTLSDNSEADDAPAQ